MKIFRMFFRTVRDAFKSVFRNFSLSLASISCITITLIIVAISLIATLNLNNFTKVIKEDVTIIVWIKKDIESSIEATIEPMLKSNKNIESVEYKSKTKAKEEMMMQDDYFKRLMEGWSEEDNPFRHSYLVKVKDIEQIHQTAKEIEKINGVDYVDYGAGMVETLISSFKLVQKASVLVVIALAVVTTFLIVNTIKLTIYSRKREISIMRLVGASNTTIKMPFVVEGMVLGIIGSIIPIICTTYGYLVFYNHFKGQLLSPVIKLITPEPFIYMISLVVLVTGIIVGMLGSYRAVRKYLKV